MLYIDFKFVPVYKLSITYGIDCVCVCVCVLLIAWPKGVWIKVWSIMKMTGME